MSQRGASVVMLGGNVSKSLLTDYHPAFFENFEHRFSVCVKYWHMMLSIRSIKVSDSNPETDQTDKPGNVNETTKPIDAHPQLQAALERLFQRMAVVNPNLQYKYDFGETQRKLGSALAARDNRIYENAPRPAVPPLSEQFSKSLAHTVKKQYERGASHSRKDLTMSNLNTNFCKPCRRIFDGNGSFVLPMTRFEKGLYYSHWDCRMLKRSARKCPLCFLLNRSLDTSVDTQELIPGHYDFVEFVRAKNVYAVRFSYYVMSLGREGLAPRITTSSLITMEAIESG